MADIGLIMVGLYTFTAFEVELLIDMRDHAYHCHRPSITWDAICRCDSPVHSPGPIHYALVYISKAFVWRMTTLPYCMLSFATNMANNRQLPDDYAMLTSRHSTRYFQVCGPSSRIT